MMCRFKLSLSMAFFLTGLIFAGDANAGTDHLFFRCNNELKVNVNIKETPPKRIEYFESAPDGSGSTGRASCHLGQFLLGNNWRARFAFQWVGAQNRLTITRAPSPGPVPNFGCSNNPNFLDRIVDKIIINDFSQNKTKITFEFADSTRTEEFLNCDLLFKDF